MEVLKLDKKMLTGKLKQINTYIFYTLRLYLHFVPVTQISQKFLESNKFVIFLNFSLNKTNCFHDGLNKI